MRSVNDFRTSTGDDGVITIDLGDIYAAETRSVVLRLSLRPVQATGSVLLGDLDVSWAAINEQIALHSLSLPVEIQAGMPGDIDLEENDRVREQVLILQAARDERAGRDAAEAGDFNQAALHLRSAASYLTQTSMPTSYLRTLESDADALSQGMWSAESSKRRFSASRENSKGRRSSFNDSKDSK